MSFCPFKTKGAKGQDSAHTFTGFFVFEHFNWNISYSKNVYELWLKKKYNNSRPLIFANDYGSFKE